MSSEKRTKFMTRGTPTDKLPSSAGFKLASLGYRIFDLNDNLMLGLTDIECWRFFTGGYFPVPQVDGIRLILSEYLVNEQHLQHVIEEITGPFEDFNG